MHTLAGHLKLWAALVCATFLVACGGGASSAASSAAGGGAHSGTVNMLCFTSTDTQKVVVSRVFPIKPYPPERMIEEPWAQDFRRYVGQSGNEGGINVSCAQVTASDTQKSKADELRKQGHDVVESQWAYAGT